MAKRRRVSVNISIPADLRERLRRVGRTVNISNVAAEALQKALADKMGETRYVYQVEFVTELRITSDEPLTFDEVDANWTDYGQGAETWNSYLRGFEEIRREERRSADSQHP